MSGDTNERVPLRVVLFDVGIGTLILVALAAGAFAAWRLVLGACS